MTAECLHSLRVEQINTEAGPVMYEVHVLWNEGPWRTRQFFSRLEADTYAKGLLEGLNAHSDRNTIFSWNHNDDAD